MHRRVKRNEKDETLFSVYFCVCTETLMMVNYYKSYAHTKLGTTNFTHYSLTISVLLELNKTFLFLLCKFTFENPSN